jgi:hypothetical protein
MVFAALDSDTSLLAAQRDALVEHFSENPSDPSAPLPVPAVGAWAYPVDCASIVADADLSGVPGLGERAVGRQTGGNDAFYPEAESALWGEFTPPLCGVDGEDATIEFDARGGSRWMEGEVSATWGASPLVLSGIDKAFSIPDKYGYTDVEVFDGPNWLSFRVKHLKNAEPIATALVAALDKTGAQ